MYTPPERCTIKKRRQVAKILAARDGSEVVQKYNEMVGEMSDDEVLKFLKENLQTNDEVEKLTAAAVEELRPNETTGDNLYNLVENLIDNYLIKNNWDGEKITPLQWGAVCMYVGAFFRSQGFFRGSDSIKDIYGNRDKYINIQAVGEAVPVWLRFCYKFNKSPLKCDFFEFVGISQQYVYNGLTPECMELNKTLEKIQADGLRRKVLNGKESPIGAIFLLKADHGLVEATKVQHEYIKQDNNSNNLPVFASDPLEIEENNAK